MALLSGLRFFPYTQYLVDRLCKSSGQQFYCSHNSYPSGFPNSSIYGQICRFPSGSIYGSIWRRYSSKLCLSWKTSHLGYCVWTPKLAYPNIKIINNKLDKFIFGRFPACRFVGYIPAYELIRDSRYFWNSIWPPNMGYLWCFWV